MKRVAAAAVLGALVLTTAGVAANVVRRPRADLSSGLPGITYRTSAGPLALRPSTATPAVPTVVVLFDTRCGHCHAALAALDRAMDSTADTRFVFLTTEAQAPDSLMRANWPRLSATPRVSWGTIPRSVATETFGFKVTPTFYLYDADGRFVAEVRGEARPAFLMKKLGGSRGRA